MKREQSTAGEHGWISYRMLPLILLLGGGLAILAVAWKSGWLPGDLLLEYHQVLQTHSREAFWSTALIYVCIYAMVVAMALPGGTIMSLAGGFLFGPLFGTLFALTGATSGAVITLFAVHSALSTILLRRSSRHIDRIRIAFHRSPVRYLLLLRLIPVFPFFAVNIVIAAMGVRAWLYLWTTVVGLLPSTIAFAILGDGLSDQLAQDRLPGAGLLLEPAILWPAVFLAALTLWATGMRRRL